MRGPAIARNWIPPLRAPTYVGCPMLPGHAAMPLTLPPLLPDRPRRLALLDPHPVLRLGVEVLLRQHAGVQAGEPVQRGAPAAPAGAQPDVCRPAADRCVAHGRPGRWVGPVARAVAALAGTAGAGARHTAMPARWPPRCVPVRAASCPSRRHRTCCCVPLMWSPGRALRATGAARGTEPAGHACTQNAGPGTGAVEPARTGSARAGAERVSTSEMALRSGRSASTISSQKTSAYRKLGIRGDGDLFRFRHLLECG